MEPVESPSIPPGLVGNQTPNGYPMIGSMVLDQRGEYSRDGVFKKYTTYGQIGIVVDVDTDWDYDGVEEISYLVHWIAFEHHEWFDTSCDYGRWNQVEVIA